MLVTLFGCVVGVLLFGSFDLSLLFAWMCLLFLVFVVCLI